MGQLRRLKLNGCLPARPELSDANLRGADLRRTKLQGSDLRWTLLQGADLREAIFGKLSLSKNQIDESANIFPEAGIKSFIEHLQRRNGKNTDFTDAKYSSLCHNASQWLTGAEAELNKPCAPRQDFYRNKLLCESPTFIDHQNEIIQGYSFNPNRYKSLFSKEELRKIIKEKCPQHLGRVTEDN